MTLTGSLLFCSFQASLTRILKASSVSCPLPSRNSRSLIMTSKACNMAQRPNRTKARAIFTTGASRSLIALRVTVLPKGRIAKGPSTIAVHTWAPHSWCGESGNPFTAQVYAICCIPYIVYRIPYVLHQIPLFYTKYHVPYTLYTVGNVGIGEERAQEGARACRDLGLSLAHALLAVQQVVACMHRFKLG